MSINPIDIKRITRFVQMNLDWQVDDLEAKERLCKTKADRKSE